MICNRLVTCVDQMITRHGGFCEIQNNCVCFCDTRSNLSCTERQKTYTIDNPNRKYTVLSYHVDTGIIIIDNTTPTNTKKCDYMFVFNDNKPTAILIELKGQNTNDAIEQISETLVHLNSFFRKCGRVYGRIVNTQGIPNMQNTPQFIKLNTSLKKMNGNLKSAERNFKDKFLGLD